MRDAREERPSRRTTVRSLLELEIFHRAGAFLSAGEHGLDRPVRWVHAGEISDIAQFLSGGEVLLTAGQGIGETETEQRAYVQSIAQVGVAGLVVELSGRAFTEFPSAVVTEADKHGLPLIGLREEVPFVEVSARVLELLTDDQHRELARSVAINKILTAQLLHGADHIALVRHLALNVDRPLVLETAAHEVEAFYGETDLSRPLLTDWARHSRSVDEHHEGGASRTCSRVPIVVQGSTWGWLHMPNLPQENDLDRVVLEQGASAIAISLLTERVAGARSGHHQGVLVTRMMLGDISGAGFVERALRLGKDLRTSRLVVVMVASESEPTGEVERAVRESLADSHLPAVTADIGDAVLSVVGLRSDRSVRLIVEALGCDDRVMGFSKIGDVDILPAGVQQARAAFSAHQPYQFFDRLGLLRLLVPLSSGSELAAFVEDELGSLLAYDSERSSSLYDTLVAFLDCDGNKTNAAKALFIQRRTLYYRLDKTSQILGLSLDDPEVRLRLQVAVRGLTLLRSNRETRTVRD